MSGVQGIRGLGPSSMLTKSRTWGDVKSDVDVERFGGSSGPVRKFDMGQLIELDGSLSSDVAYDPKAIPRRLKGILDDAAMVHLLSVWDPEGNLRRGFDVNVVRQVAAPLASVRPMYYDFWSLDRVPVKQYAARGAIDMDLLRRRSPDLASYLAGWAGRLVRQPEVNDYVEFTGRVLKSMPSTPSNNGTGVGPDSAVDRIANGFGESSSASTGSMEYRVQPMSSVWRPLGALLQPLRVR